jgi:hypothetical protein
VSQFMNRFLNQALAEEFTVGRKAIEFLAQSVSGKHGAWAAHLRLAEDESKNRDVQIDGCDPQHSPGVRLKKGLHALQDFRRVVLLALSVECELRIKTGLKNFAWDAKNLFDGWTQILQQFAIYIPDRQQLQQLHRVPSSGDFIGLLVSIGRSSAPAVLFQLVIERDPVDVKNVGSVALVPGTLLDHAQDVSALHIFKSLA